MAKKTVPEQKSTTPSNLKDEGKQVFEEIEKLLQAEKLITPLDRTNLVFFASIFQDLVHLDADIASLRDELVQLKSAYSITDEEGRKIIASARSALDSAYSKKSRVIGLMHTLGQSLGLSAKARKSLPTAQKDNPFLALMGGT